MYECKCIYGRRMKRFLILISEDWKWLLGTMMSVSYWGGKMISNFLVQEEEIKLRFENEMKKRVMFFWRKQENKTYWTAFGSWNLVYFVGLLFLTPDQKKKICFLHLINKLKIVIRLFLFARRLLHHLFFFWVFGKIDSFLNKIYNGWIQAQENNREKLQSWARVP